MGRARRSRRTELRGWQRPIIGHFIADLPVAGEAGVQPYIFVERVDETLEKIAAHRGEVVTAPYPEGDLWVATFRDPGGNVLGVWQTGSL